MIVFAVLFLIGIAVFFTALAADQMGANPNDTIKFALLSLVLTFGPGFILALDVITEYYKNTVYATAVANPEPSPSK